MQRPSAVPSGATGLGSVGDEARERVALSCSCFMAAKNQNTSRSSAPPCRKAVGPRLVPPGRQVLTQGQVLDLLRTNKDFRLKTGLALTFRTGPPAFLIL
jgi:hypothetical protein